MPPGHHNYSLARPIIVTFFRNHGMANLAELTPDSLNTLYDALDWERDENESKHKTNLLKWIRANLEQYDTKERIGWTALVRDSMALRQKVRAARDGEAGEEVNVETLATNMDIDADSVPPCEAGVADTLAPASAEPSISMDLKTSAALSRSLASIRQATSAAHSAASEKPPAKDIKSGSKTITSIPRQAQHALPRAHTRSRRVLRSSAAQSSASSALALSSSVLSASASSSSVLSASASSSSVSSASALSSSVSSASASSSLVSSASASSPPIASPHLQTSGLPASLPDSNIASGVDLTTLKVAQLRGVLKKIGLAFPPSAKKAQLLTLLKEAMKTKESGTALPAKDIKPEADKPQEAHISSLPSPCTVPNMNITPHTGMSTTSTTSIPATQHSDQQDAFVTPMPVHVPSTSIPAPTSRLTPTNIPSTLPREQDLANLRQALTSSFALFKLGHLLDAVADLSLGLSIIVAVAGRTGSHNPIAEDEAETIKNSDKVVTTEETDVFVRGGEEEDVKVGMVKQEHVDSDDSGVWVDEEGEDEVL